MPLYHYTNFDSLKGILDTDYFLTEEILEIRKNSYICCFTDSPNNNQLWDERAGGNDGLVIVFCESHFPVISPGHSESRNQQPTSCLKHIITYYGLDDGLRDEMHSLNIAEHFDRVYTKMIFGDAYKRSERSYESESRLIYFDSHMMTVKMATRFIANKANNKTLREKIKLGK